MELHPGEPAAIDWQTLDAPTLRAEFTPHRLILVDGGSGSGKTTFADHAATLLGAPVVRTDDIAWHHHATDWDTELITHVIEPWRRGEPVRYRPPGWVTRNRAGAVTVSAGQLIIEGVGAARASLARLADLVIWVQTDRPLARERAIGLHPDHQIRQPGQGCTGGTHPFDDQLPSGHGDRAGTVAGHPARRAVTDRFAASPRFDDVGDELGVPVGGVVVPGDVIGTHHWRAEQGGRVVGEGRLAATGATVDQDQPVRGEFGAKSRRVQRLPIDGGRFAGVEFHGPIVMASTTVDEPAAST